MLIRILRKQFPTHGIISEEVAATNADHEYCWTIDPIDGSTNFAIHSPLWSTAIALLHRGEPVLSAVFAPALQELYVAERGRGVTLNGRQVRLSPVARLDRAIVLVGRSHGRQSRREMLRLELRLIGRVLNMRSYGSASLHLGYCAAGRVAACIFAGPGQSPVWDIAPGVLMAHEAGAIVTDLAGRPWSKEGSGLVVANRTLHPKIIRALRA